MSGLSWGENFTVSLMSPGIIEISSSCRSPLQVFDWGKNRRNVDQFLAYFIKRSCATHSSLTTKLITWANPERRR